MYPKVSVIVPVHNVQKYLKETLDSLLAQTFKDFEIICIDNKSTDNTLKILKEYAKNDERFIIFEKKENIKQGLARNFGISVATGEYIFFLDGDDIIMPDCLEKMYNKAVSDDSDITVCCWALLDDLTKKVNDKHDYALLKQIPEEVNDKVFHWRDIKNSIFWQSSVPWDKIYKRSFLIEKDVKFPGGVFFEDNVFVYDAFFKSNRISVLRDILMLYRTNRKGAVTNSKNKLFFDYLKIFNMIGDNLKKIGLYDEMKYLYLDYKIITLYWWFKLIKPQYKWEFFNKIKEDFKKIEIKEEEKEFVRNRTLFLFYRFKNIPFLIYLPFYFIDRVYRVEKGKKSKTVVWFSTFEKWCEYKN